METFSSRLKTFFSREGLVETAEVPGSSSMGFSALAPRFVERPLLM